MERLEGARKGPLPYPRLPRPYNDDYGVGAAFIVGAGEWSGWVGPLAGALLQQVSGEWSGWAGPLAGALLQQVSVGEAGRWWRAT